MLVEAVDPMGMMSVAGDDVAGRRRIRGGRATARRAVVAGRGLTVNGGAAVRIWARMAAMDEPSVNEAWVEQSLTGRLLVASPELGDPTLRGPWCCSSTTTRAGRSASS